MSIDYMGTIDRFAGDKRRWKLLIDTYDIHKWIIGIEKGKGGLEHLQIRIRMREGELDKAGRNAFDVLKLYFPKGHFEKCSDTWTYEAKEGRFWASDDYSNEVRKERFAKPRKWQKEVLTALRKQNDRQIMVIVNREGNMGKSFLRGHLYETGKAHFIQYANNTKGLLMDTASKFIKQGGRPYLIIDLPRAWKWSEELCIALETIKDGLIDDPRYESKTINIRGVKILVFCNTSPNDYKGVYESLSADRWCIGNLYSGADVISWESRATAST